MAHCKLCSALYDDIYRMVDTELGEIPVVEDLCPKCRKDADYFTVEENCDIINQEDDLEYISSYFNIPVKEDSYE